MSNFVPPPVVLFLQGPPSVFWRQLAEAFEQSGVQTHRVNFSLGDQVYWLKRGAINYRKSIRHWPEFLRNLITREKITDILYYADQLPYHKIAHDVAQELGVKCHAIEFGYLRPDWITLERGGMGRYSHFPDTPEQITAIARQVNHADLIFRYPHTFGQEAFNEVLYNLVAYFGRPFFPLYRSDKYYDPLLDYLTWIPRFFRTPKTLPLDYIGDEFPPFYMLALQLQSDYQIRANSNYTHLSEMVDEVVRSFATFAPKHFHLIVKQHPLDNDMEKWEKVTKRIARLHGVEDRVIFYEKGDINIVLPKTTGVILVNSTVGLHSLRAGKPTLVLGTAIYDIEGLTHRTGLDTFWTEPEPVDPVLLADYVNALAATVQVKGDFYNRDGRRVAIKQIVERIRQNLVNQPDGFLDPPPRHQDNMSRI